MKPPRLALLVLRALLRDAAARETICGDLEEELAERAERNPRAARRWAVALLAQVAPLRRALRLDPARALRAE